MKNIYDYSLEQLTEYFQSIKQKPFRAKQVFSWLYQKDARSFDDMSDLSKELRNSLKDEFNFDILKIKDYYKLLDEMVGKDPYGNVSNDNIVEYHIRYKDKKSKDIFVKNLRHGKLFAFYHDPDDPLSAHLFDKRNDKVKAIQTVAALEHISQDRIYTIGDGYNDLSMIKKFNGFAIRNSKDAVKYESLGTYETVSELMEDIEKQNISKRPWKNYFLNKFML